MATLELQGGEVVRRLSHEAVAEWAKAWSEERDERCNCEECCQEAAECYLDLLLHRGADLALACALLDLKDARRLLRAALEGAKARGATEEWMGEAERTLEPRIPIDE